MFDEICGLCVNAISIPTAIYLVNSWHLRAISTIVIAMTLWVAIDLVLGGLVLYFNSRLELFRSEFLEREERNQRSRQIEEELVKGFGVPNRGPTRSEDGYWRRPR